LPKENHYNFEALPALYLLSQLGFSWL